MSIISRIAAEKRRGVNVEVKYAGLLGIVPKKSKLVKGDMISIDEGDDSEEELARRDNSSGEEGPAEAPAA